MNYVELCCEQPYVIKLSFFFITLEKVKQPWTTDKKQYMQTRVNKTLDLAT